MRAFAEKEGLTFVILLDEDSEVAKRYRVRGIPISFFIDREGAIQARHTGPLSGSLLRQYLEPIP